jgi:hypothetical protein
MPRPPPIPDHLNRLDAISKFEITRCELLASTPHANGASGKGQVSKVATRSVLHEDSNVGSTISLAHDKLNVFNARSLAHLPVNTRGGYKDVNNPQMKRTSGNIPNPSGVTVGQPEISMIKLRTWR